MSLEDPISLDNVARIPAPQDPGTLARQYLFPHVPVILTDLFGPPGGGPLSSLDAIGAVEVAMQPNYLGALLDGRVPEQPRRMRVDAWAAALGPGPSSDLRCVEYDTPAELRDALPAPIYCSLNDPADVRSQTFLARAGASSHLHYDRDQRAVLMYAAIGRKRFVIIHPRETAKLEPFADPNVQRTSTLFLEHFNDDDKTAFLRYAHAWDCVLHPGETLVMPAMTWHYVEYLDDALSVSFRLGRNRYNRLLADGAPVPSVYVQALAVAFADTPTADRDSGLQDAYARLHRAVAAGASATDLDQLCLQLADDLGLTSASAPYSFRSVELRRLSGAS